MNGTAPAAERDRPVLERWWGEFVATGRLPAELECVQGRIVRSVHRGVLPSGPVYVKAMTFPRAKDKVRYLLRPLPALHEARLLRATAAAGIACPEVLAVRTARRRGVPTRSMLVLRALPVRPDLGPEGPCRLLEESVLAARLLAAGIVHRDLHSGNFVRLVDGSLAVLDMQSASRRVGRASVRDRRRAATRLLQDRGDIGLREAAEILVGSGLLESADAACRAHVDAERARASFTRGRILRCLGETTEFTRRWGWRGVTHRTRGEPAPGRWRTGGRTMRRAWIGQRALQVLEGRPLAFPAFFQNWWWLGGGGALYIPHAWSEDRTEAEVREAAAGYARLLECSRRPGREGHGGHRTGTTDR